MENKLTAVEWMTKQLAENWNDENISLVDIYNKAKKMEWQQLIDAYEQGEDDGYWHPENGYDRQFSDSKQYYNETYGK